MTNSSVEDTICCPRFDPVPWDDKLFTWDNKIFIKSKVCTAFFMPLNFGRVMKKLDKKVRQAEARVPDWLCLSEHTSQWNMNLYLAVDKVIPGIENATLSGNYYSKVYEGPFKDTGKWHQDFKAILKGKGMQAKKSYIWYTTCPKCAKKYGKNYVVMLSEIE